MTIMQATPYGARIPSTVINPSIVAQAPSPPSYVNPIQTQSSEAGPSSLLASVPSKKRATSNGKRKRTDTPDSADSSSQKQKNKDGPKKKKANRACFHCQKAHLTCDDCMYLSRQTTEVTQLTKSSARPCKRCLKRGIGDSCTEGHRKKAKYLLDEDELGKCFSKVTECIVTTDKVRTEQLKCNKSEPSAPEVPQEPPPIQPTSQYPS
jgi:hypothetical protein